MKTVMVFGTFDLLHPGHESLFSQAKQHGDTLIAVVARDETVENIKGKKPQQSEKTRLSAVRKQKDVDKAVLGNKKDPYLIIQEHKPDIICLGYDQNSFTLTNDTLHELGLHAGIMRMEPYKEDVYKSSKIKK